MSVLQNEYLEGMATTMRTLNQVARDAAQHLNTEQIDRLRNFSWRPEYYNGAVRHLLDEDEFGWIVQTHGKKIVHACPLGYAFFPAMCRHGGYDYALTRAFSGGGDYSAHTAQGNGATTHLGELIGYLDMSAAFGRHRLGLADEKDLSRFVRDHVTSQGISGPQDVVNAVVAAYDKLHGITPAAPAQADSAPIDQDVVLAAAALTVLAQQKEVQPA